MVVVDGGGGGRGGGGGKGEFLCVFLLQLLQLLKQTFVIVSPSIARCSDDGRVFCVSSKFNDAMSSVTLLEQNHYREIFSRSDAHARTYIVATAFAKQGI